MGNYFSSQDNAADALRDLVLRPGSPEIVLTAETINKGLTKVAKILRKKGRNVTIVAVGGAVNTLFLRSRTQTSDVDFFYRTKTQDASVSAIVNAARTAAKSIEVGEGWLNNHTAIFITEVTIGDLYQEAVTQNAVIFEAPGLKVIAAPWRYALCTKLKRLGESSGDEKIDLSDAVAYLRQLRKKRGAVTVQEITSWFTEFRFKRPSNSAMTEVATAYRKKYKAVGIQI